MKKKSLPNQNLNNSCRKKNINQIKGNSDIINNILNNNKENSNNKIENKSIKKSAFDQDLYSDYSNNQNSNSSNEKKNDENIPNYIMNVIKKIHQDLNFDNQEKNLTNNKLQNEKKKYEKKSEFDSDKSLIKHLEIEIIFNIKNNSSNSNKKSNLTKINNKIKSINEYFSNKNIFYYEYSNTRNISTITIGKIDNNLYESYYKNELINQIQLSSIKNNEHLQKIKIIDYISSLNSVYNNALLNKEFFYIVNPMHTYYFDMKIEKLYLSNIIRIENILEENEILYNKIQPLKEELENNKKKNEYNILKFNDFPVIIDKFYMMNFFNVFINNGSEVKSFNIYSPFNFEGATCRKCKIYQETFEKEDMNIISIHIYGILFENNLKEIIDYLKNTIKCKKFSIKLNKIKSTESFFRINKNLKRPIDWFEYKDSFFFTII